MTAPSATLNKVRYRIIDVATTNPLMVSATTLEEAVVQAVTRYSRDRPLISVADVVGNGTPYYPIIGAGAVLANWTDGLSRIQSVEYPAGSVGANHVPSYLVESDDWEYYETPSITYVRFKTATPAATETLRISYSSRHTHTTVTDTVKAFDLDALCDLAAFFSCMALATKAAASSDPSINADSVSHRDAQLKFKQQADAWLTSYNDRMGIKTGEGVRGASAVGDWDGTFQTGLPFLTHWGRRR